MPTIARSTLPALLAAALLAALGGCTRDPTEIVLAVATDLQAPQEIDQVLIGIDGDADKVSWDLTPGRADSVTLPATLGLVSPDDEEHELELVVGGLKDDEVVVQRTVKTRFVAHEVLLLRVELLRSCASKWSECQAGQTCVDGSCRSAEAYDLPPYDEDEALRPLDAAPAGDAGPDSRADAESDAGGDAEADTAADAVPDAAADAVPDAAADAESDAAADAESDAAADAVFDAAPDFASDALPDAALDTGPPFDGSPDASTDSTTPTSWPIAFGGSGDDRAWDIAATEVAGAVRVAIVGSVHGTIDVGGHQIGGVSSKAYGFVVVLDDSGTVRWTKSFGGSGFNSEAKGVAYIGGDVVLVGEVSGNILWAGCESSGHNQDVLMARLDGETGQCEWVEYFGADGRDRGLNIAASSDRIAVTGSTKSAVIDFGGGNLTNFAPGDGDMFVAMFYANSDHIWSKRVGGTGAEAGHGVAIDSANNTVVTGDADGAMFVSRYDHQGTEHWSKATGDGDDQGVDVAVTSLGDAIVLGDFGGTITLGTSALTSSGRDLFVASFAKADGSCDWAYRYGGGGTEYAHAIAAAGDEVIVAAAFENAIDFGAGVMNGNRDGVIARFHPPSENVAWAQTFGGGGFDAVTGFAAHGAVVYLVGTFASTHFDPGSGDLPHVGGNDVFALRYTPP